MLDMKRREHWVKAYLNTAQYIVKPSVKGTGIGSYSDNASLSTRDSASQLFDLHPELTGS